MFLAQYVRIFLGWGDTDILKRAAPSQSLLVSFLNVCFEFMLSFYGENNSVYSKFHIQVPQMMEVQIFVP